MEVHHEGARRPQSSLKAESNNSIGGVTVSIRVDGEPFLTQTKNDTFAVAMVAGLVP
ncbi:MAG: hypothetical protein IPG74_03200 [Flavobacteriales bacterium]|nr:hypothetical protein [Flavobacteriales bacterium]